MPISTFALWIALVWGAGWLFFPISQRIFGDALPDGGLAVGRVLFLTGWTLVAFWAGYAGVSTSIAAFGWIVLAAVGMILERRDREALQNAMRVRKRAIFASEAIFLGFFLLFFVLRGFWSDMSGANGEKSMDGALIASLMRAQNLPPLNPFSAGAHLNAYYYFGHLETALLTQAVGGSLRWTYNLMCATVPALCFSTLFCLGAALTQRLRGGLFVMATVFSLGTLEPIVQWLSLRGLYAQKFGANTRLGLDHFATSRVIPYTINEYPWFTFHQADLHAHYLAFPLVLATMCLAWALFRGSKTAFVPAILVLGAQILTNTWDFPVFGLLLGVAIVLAGMRPVAPTDSDVAPKKAASMAMRVSLAFVIFAGAILVALPYLIHLKTAATPPKPLAQPASPLREWLLFWGPMATAWAAFLCYSPWENSRWKRASCLICGLLIVIVALRDDWAAPSRVVLPLILVFLISSLWGARKWRDDTRFLAILAFCGFVALLWAETTWAGFLGNADYAGADDYKRQDTVFKFGLQTWMLWGTAASCGAYLTLRRWPAWLKCGFVPVLSVMLIASTAVVFGRTRNFAAWDGRAPVVPLKVIWDGWDGWAHLAPPEKEAAQWLIDNTPRGQNLLEAESKAGGDFTEFARYSSLTGIPTVMGPLSHTFYWSPANSGDGGREWAEVYRRKADARALYLSPSPRERRRLLKQYGVRFVVFGLLEQSEYSSAALDELRRDLKQVQQFGAANDPRRVVIFKNEER